MDSIHAEPDETLLVSAAVLGQVHIESRCESHRQAVQTPEQLPQPTHLPPAGGRAAGAGSYLSSREQTCLDNCARRFLETTQFVVKYYQSKAQHAAGGGGSF
jgi:hypothetical protein